MTNFIETQKELAREHLKPNVTYADRRVERVAKFAEQILESFWVEQQKDLDALITQVIQNTLEEVENNRDDDSCECDNCHRWRRIRKSLLAEMVIKKEV